MAAGEKAHEHAVDDLLVADHHFLDFTAQLGELLAKGRDLLLHLGFVRHRHANLPRWACLGPTRRHRADRVTSK